MLEILKLQCLCSVMHQPSANLEEHKDFLEELEKEISRQNAETSGGEWVLPEVTI